MNFVLFFLAAVQIVSVAFMGICLMRLFSYSHRYKLKENEHTLLFGLLRVEHFVLLYMLFVTGFAIGSTLFIYLLIK
jgi:hypothetical protein